MGDEAIIKEMLSIPYRCSICERIDRSEFDYMSEIQYQILRDDGAKTNFIKKGFCNYHFWKIASLTTPEAVASMGAMLIENDKYPSNSCLICEYLNGKEAEFIDEFVKNITGADPENSNQSRKRLCQPHFRLTLKHLDGEIAEYFSSIQKIYNEQLLMELKSFVEKRNGRHERDKNEKTSWWRAVEKLVGRKGMWGK
jgi:hypothetical protein